MTALAQGMPPNSRPKTSRNEAGRILGSVYPHNRAEESSVKSPSGAGLVAALAFRMPELRFHGSVVDRIVQSRVDQEQQIPNL